MMVRPNIGPLSPSVLLMRLARNTVGSPSANLWPRRTVPLGARRNKEKSGAARGEGRATTTGRRRHRWRGGTIAMSHNAILAVISLLAEKCPSCFSIIESGRRPLKLGIRDDVLAALDGAISAGKVLAALRWCVSSPEYQRR